MSLTLCLLNVWLLAGSSFPALAQDGDLPPVALDALDPARWSETSLVAAPGQVIRITNRGVQRHTFAVREWNVDVELPTLSSVDVVVPEDVSPGQVFVFYCAEPGHNSLGQQGSITIVTPDEARQLAKDTEGSQGNRLRLETGDDNTWNPPSLEARPGQFIEISNNGVIEHHFVVDEWGINETISPGEVALVQVPDNAEVGKNYIYYCSVPGHRDAGEEGSIAVVDADDQGRTDPGSTNQRTQPDLAQFVPDAEIFGQGWTLVRTGDARAVVVDFDSLNSRVFPGTGRGATYVGPAGSRATVLVLPFAPFGVPGNQVDDSITTLQLMLMSEWETNLRAADSLNKLPAPSGCDAANRVAGVTRVYTLPAGSTVCQLRAAQIAIFVTIEGSYETWQGVEASDQVVLRLLQGT